jgi:hypothetical protein
MIREGIFKGLKSIILENHYMKATFLPIARNFILPSASRKECAESFKKIQDAN